MVFKINGIDLFALDSKLKIAIDGLEIELHDIDSEGTERVESGVMQRDKIAEAHTINVTFRPMKPEDITGLLTECRKPFVDIQFSDPYNGFSTTTATFYNSNRNIKFFKIDSSTGAALYDKVTLKFIGRGRPVGGGGDW